MGANKAMRKTIIALLIIMTMGITTACGSSEENNGAEQQTTAAAEEQTVSNETDARDSMVICFSVTGHTKGVAEMIAEIADADMYEIIPAEPYTDEDIDYNNENSRATKEQNDKSSRPAFAGDVPSLDGVETVFLGYPIWWGEEPRIMDTFVEAVDFEGITVIPFCTSGSSGIGDSGKKLEQNAGSGTWVEGKRFDAGASEEEVRGWIDSL